MPRQGKGPHGPNGGREPFVQLGGNGHDDDNPGRPVNQAAENITPLRAHDAGYDDAAQAMRLADRAVRHGGRRGLVLLHCAGYLAARSLGHLSPAEANQ